MSAKNRDEHNRWRNKTIGFRMSPEEAAQLDTAVRLSGLTKQDYITKKLLDRDVVVQANPRVYKALRGQLSEVLDELKRIDNGRSVNDGLLETINLIAQILNGLKETCQLITETKRNAAPNPSVGADGGQQLPFC